MDIEDNIIKQIYDMTISCCGVPEEYIIGGAVYDTKFNVAPLETNLDNVLKQLDLLATSAPQIKEPVQRILLSLKQFK